MKLSSLFCILVVVTAGSIQATGTKVERIANAPRVLQALAWLGNHLDQISADQIRITEIPAPPFAEHARADLFRKLLESTGLQVRTDAEGSVIAERPGSETGRVLLLVAHLDTVFPSGTDVRVKRSGSRLLAPGISDNGAGLAALLAVAEAISASKIPTQMTLVFAADVGEEGEGNLRGIRRLVEDYGDRLRGVIAIDGPSVDHITTQGVASRRLEVAITGPGGHSWSDFGTPNPITALARAIVRFSSSKMPAEPRTTYNLAMIEGGTSVNAIPYRAALRVDIRSEDEHELQNVESLLKAAVQAAIADELAATKSGDSDLQAAFRLLGLRPAGKLADNSPLLAAAQSVDRYLGNDSRLERSSTDANIPLSLGIPAIALGGGGHGSGSHSLNEWYDPSDRELGLKRLLLTVLTFAGVQP